MTIDAKLQGELDAIEEIVKVLRPMRRRTQSRLLRWAKERLDEVEELASEEDELQNECEV